MARLVPALLLGAVVVAFAVSALMNGVSLKSLHCQQATTVEYQTVAPGLDPLRI
ncbi:hypothetical protein ACWIGI_16770 [Nocardia sp. NPDC055321]